jgi:hypothetical protein
MADTESTARRAGANAANKTFLMAGLLDAR